MKRGASPARRGFNFFELILILALLLAGGVACWYLQSRFGLWSGLGIFLGVTTVYPTAPLVLDAARKSGVAKAGRRLVVCWTAVLCVWLAACLGGALFGAMGMIFAPASAALLFAMAIMTVVEIWPEAGRPVRRADTPSTRASPAGLPDAQSREPSKRGTDSSTAP